MRPDEVEAAYDRWTSPKGYGVGNVGPQPLWCQDAIRLANAYKADRATRAAEREAVRRLYAAAQALLNRCDKLPDFQHSGEDLLDCLEVALDDEQLAPYREDTNATG